MVVRNDPTNLLLDHLDMMIFWKKLNQQNEKIENCSYKCPICTIVRSESKSFNSFAINKQNSPHFKVWKYHNLSCLLT